MSRDCAHASLWDGFISCTLEFAIINLYTTFDICRFSQILKIETATKEFTLPFYINAIHTILLVYLAVQLTVKRAYTILI